MLVWLRQYELGVLGLWAIQVASQQMLGWVSLTGAPVWLLIFTSMLIYRGNPNCELPHEKFSLKETEKWCCGSL